MTYLEKAQDLYQKINQGQAQDAFEEFYAENCRIEEPTGEVREGKAVQRAAIEQWLSRVEEFHGAKTISVTSNEAEGTTMVESWMEITSRGQRMEFQQVASQKWENGQIVEERFYHDTYPMRKAMEEAAKQEQA